MYSCPCTNLLVQAMCSCQNPFSVEQRSSAKKLSINCVHIYGNLPRKFRRSSYFSTDYATSWGENLIKKKCVSVNLPIAWAECVETTNNVTHKEKMVIKVLILDGFTLRPTSGILKSNIYTAKKILVSMYLFHFIFIEKITKFGLN